MKVIVTKDKLSEAAAQGIITQDQEEILWNWFTADSRVDMEDSQMVTSESAFVKMLYYSGTFIIIGAMGWFMNRVWDSWYGAGIAGIALVYALGFILIGKTFSSKSAVASHLFYVMAVAMTPLFTYGMLKWFGIWPGQYPGDYRDFYTYIRGGWMTMELVTLAVGTAALRYIKIPAAMAVPAFILWYMSMDITPILFGDSRSWDNQKYVSIAFGAMMILAAFFIDNRRKVDYGKWLYIFGGMAFWGGLSALVGSSEWSKLIYFLINMILMCAGTLLERKVFMILGSLGCIGYIGHLAYSIFQHSSFFPVALAGFGLLVVYTGWFFHKNREMIRVKVFEITPQVIINRLPRNRKI